MSKFSSLPLTRRRGRLAKALFYVFIIPVFAQAGILVLEGRSMSLRRADWSSAGILPPAQEYEPARVVVFSGRTGGIKGVVARHSWIVYKRSGDATWTRYDVVGWGDPIRRNWRPPDGRWFGDAPIVVADRSGAAADALIPRIEAAIRSYPYGDEGDYWMWPGPNSNTFVASILRAIPEIGATLPPNAIGRDFRPSPYAGATDSGTGVELSAWGLIGVKIGWVEGIELNFLSLVVGLDLRHPGLKLPAFGRLGFDAFSPPAAGAAGR
ncbi:MAG: DUF3750 domain-containing protein [Proteobacteria bacterium]|nr:DUF3750 domain-containing protein [Pseudomonadota bacterium]